MFRIFAGIPTIVNGSTKYILQNREMVLAKNEVASASVMATVLQATRDINGAMVVAK